MKVKITKKQASLMLGVTTRTIENHHKHFLSEGIKSFKHKNHVRIPKIKIPKEDEQEIVDYYLKYFKE